MGTNYYWYLDQELLHSPDIYRNNESLPSLVKKVYEVAQEREQDVNEYRDNYLDENDSIVKDFSYLSGAIQVTALHIGKRSWGWTFGMHVYPELVETYDQWVQLMPYGTIKDEYRDLLTTSQMLEIIDVDGLIGIEAEESVKRSRSQARQDQYSWFDQEYHLWRRVQDQAYVIGAHKAVDYCIGHFS